MEGIMDTHSSLTGQTIEIWFPPIPLKISFPTINNRLLSLVLKKRDTRICTGTNYLNTLPSKLLATAISFPTNYVLKMAAKISLSNFPAGQAMVVMYRSEHQTRRNGH